MKRSQIREFTMQLIFEIEGQQDFSEVIKDRFLKKEELINIDKEYVDKIYKNFVGNKEIIDEMISKFLTNWKINRMNKVDLAICRLAVTELLYLEEIPKSVVINEAVNLAKKFGTEKSGKFVNGVLGSIAKEI